MGVSEVQELGEAGCLSGTQLLDLQKEELDYNKCRGKIN